MKWGFFALFCMTVIKKDIRDRGNRSNVTHKDNYEKLFHPFLSLDGATKFSHFL